MKHLLTRSSSISTPPMSPLSFATSSFLCHCGAPMLLGLEFAVSSHVTHIQRRGICLMANSNKPVERRKHKRFQVQPGRVAVLTPRWPHSTIVGDILDISERGLALRYVADEAPSNRSSDLTIVSAKPNFHLGKLPFKTISDFEIAKAPFSSMAPRRLSLQFGELTQDQTARLEHFITTHTIGES